MRSVLVVEDDPDARDGFVALLESEGFAAAGVANGQEALDWLERFGTPCLIVLDLTMPVMDGWQFRARQIADPRLRSIPLVVVTAHREPERNGIDATSVLEKPIPPESLLEIVRTTCR